ncbi:inhibitor of apoptosis IAP repeat-containing protein, partial [Gloeophyllum trabeum ATCC 11539]
MASMEVLQNRLDSFKTKRGKPSSKASASSSKKWPHPSVFKANPETLAEAGFYFTPTAQDKDNVACYMCKKHLSDWEEDDDPHRIHWAKCQDTCPWAIVRCGLEEDIDEDGNFVATDAKRLPSGKAMEKARLDTFRFSKSWPHDSVKNHGATSKKMAKAGFVYTPQSEGDDTATCLYCSVSLSGWEPEDDPLYV